MNKKPVAYSPGRQVGQITGTATVKFHMHPKPVEAGEGDPADLYAEYVRDQVRHIMSIGGAVPAEITVALDFADADM